MKDLTAVDLLRLVHPDPKALITLGGILSKKASEEERGKFFSLPQKAGGGRWKKGIPLFFWLKRKECTEWLGALRAVNGANHNIYYSLACYDGEMEKNRQGKLVHRRTKERVKGTQVVWLDFDDVTRASEAFQRGESFGGWPAPSIVVETSPGHCQCLWLLSEPLGREDIPRLEALLRQETRKLGADPAATDVARVFRAPGYGNANRGMFQVTAGLHHQVRYRMADFPAQEKEPEAPAPSALRGAKPLLAPRPSCSAASYDLSPLGDKIGPIASRRALDRWHRVFTETNDKEKADWAVTNYFLSLNISETAIWEWLAQKRDGRHAEHLAETVKNAAKQKRISAATPIRGE